MPNSRSLKDLVQEHRRGDIFEDWSELCWNLPTWLLRMCQAQWSKNMADEEDDDPVVAEVCFITTVNKFALFT